jgi:hypothetical protein
VRCLNSEALLAIKSALIIILASLSFQVDDVNSAWRIIKDLLISIIDAKAPIKYVRVKPKNSVPWMDKDLVCLSKQRNRLYNKAKKSKTKDDWSTYKTVRNKFTSLLKFKKIVYFNNILNRLSYSSKKLWKILYPYINPNKKQSISPSLILENTSSSNPILELANIFINYFSSIISTFPFLNINTCHNFIDNFFRNTPSLSIFHNINTKFDVSHFTRLEVEETLSRIDEFAAPGPVNIHSVIFKECAAELAPILTSFFNLCIDKSIIPDD